MQAIARANRVNAGKNNGLVVDYCGVLKHLRKALATFAGTQPGGDGGETDPARPDEDLLADLAEAIALVRAFLDAAGAPLDGVIGAAGFKRNAAIVACKEAANENDETRKRFEVTCREVFGSSGRASTCRRQRPPGGSRRHRHRLQSLQRGPRAGRHRATSSAGCTRWSTRRSTCGRPGRPGRIPPPTTSAGSTSIGSGGSSSAAPARRTTVQALKDAVEKKLRRPARAEPVTHDFQKHYEEIVAQYNREKDRVTIEQTFEALLKLVRALDREESRALREGLDEESLAIFDLPDEAGSRARPTSGGSRRWRSACWTR